MVNKKKIIIYGLGKVYRQSKKYLHNKFEVIGYSDSKRLEMKDGKEYILPNNITKYYFDYICVTSTKYFSEIKTELIELLGRENEEKIVSLYELMGNFENSQIRNAWVVEQLSKIPFGNVLLDAGAGEQKYKPYCSHLKYIAQDFGEYIPNETNTGLQDDSWNYSGLNIKCDVIEMPLENESVDVILCTEVFEHLRNPMLALKEFARILKKGGQLILTAPFCCLTHMAPYFYYNGFSEYWYEEQLADYGFDIVEFTRNGNYFNYLSQELLRIESMSERYCYYELDDEEINSIIKCMEIMTKLSGMDTNSNETLCFGNMIVAVKQRSV